MFGLSAGGKSRDVISNLSLAPPVFFHSQLPLTCAQARERKKLLGWLWAHEPLNPSQCSCPTFVYSTNQAAAPSLKKLQYLDFNLSASPPPCLHNFLCYLLSLHLKLKYVPTYVNQSQQLRCWIVSARKKVPPRTYVFPCYNVCLSTHPGEKMSALLLGTPHLIIGA